MISCNKVPLEDKGCHLIAGFVIFIITDFVVDPFAAWVAVFFAGVSKEVYDRVSGMGVADIADVLFTVIGGGIGYLIYMMIWSLYRVQ